PSSDLLHMNCFRQSTVFTAALLAACLQSIAGHPEQVLFTDDFQGKPDAAWSWLRADPEGWRVEQNALLIRTSTGGLWMKDNNNRNLLLRSLRAVKEGAVAFEVRVECEPTNAYEHAGLLCYYDDDNCALLA